MKRLLIAVAASLALAVVGPAVALGLGSHEHSRHSRDLGLRDKTPGVAGTIVSHTGNVVSVRLLDGSTVSGMLTDATQLFCIRHVATGAPRTKAHDSRDRERSDGDRHGLRGWEHASGLRLFRCSAGDARPNRRIAGGLLQISSTGSVWRLLVVWD